jgi:uncharacterized protein YbjT (DUF2867 family)
MSPDFITVTGATGHIGRRAVDILSAKGLKVRAVARRVDALKSLKGVEAVAADLSDASAAEKAFSGSKAVFALIPPNVTAPDVRADQNRVADSLVQAIERSGVTHVVALSSIGGHMSSGAGPVNGLHDWEEKLKKLSGVNVLALRPCYFMENLLVNVGLIKNMGIMGSPMRGDLRFPLIATRDIGEAVAESLEKASFTGFSVRELLGARDTTMEEARAAIAKAIGKPDLKYVQFPYAHAEKAMIGMGLSADYAGLLIEMTRGMNEGRIKPTQARDAKTTTPTTIEWFAENVFAAAFKSPAAV